VIDWLPAASVSDDTLAGTTGNDVLSGLDGDDFIYGRAGEDHLEGGSGSDWLYGGNDRDYLFGEQGDDALHGDDGGDILYGGAGRDRLFGGFGDDTLLGGDGPDYLFGAEGDDLYDGGAGDDYYFEHGGGNDTYVFERGCGRDYLSKSDGGDSSTDRVVAGEGISALDLVFRLSAGSLELGLVGTSDTLTMGRWTSGEGYQVDEFHAGDGSVLENRQVENLIQAMAGFVTEQGAANWEDAIARAPDQAQMVVSAYWENQPG
jgi:hypothetical protein